MPDTDFVARASELRLRIERLGQLRITAVDAEAVSTRAKQLEEAVGPLSELALVVEAFRRRSLAFSLPTVAVASALEAHHERHRAYREDPASVTGQSQDSSFRFQYYLPLRNLAPQLRSALMEAWQRYLDEHSPDMQQALLDALATLPGFFSQVEQIRRLHQAVSALREQLPHSEGDIDDARSLVDQLSKLWDALSGEGVDDEIVNFLRAAATSTGAPLADFNERIRTWLRVHELLDRVRIRISGQGRVGS